MKSACARSTASEAMPQSPSHRPITLGRHEVTVVIQQQVVCQEGTLRFVVHRASGCPCSWKTVAILLALCASLLSLTIICYWWFHRHSFFTGIFGGSIPLQTALNELEVVNDTQRMPDLTSTVSTKGECNTTQVISHSLALKQNGNESI